MTSNACVWAPPLSKRMNRRINDIGIYDIDLSTSVRADLNRYAAELGMTPEIQIDVVFEVVFEARVRYDVEYRSWSIDVVFRITKLNFAASKHHGRIPFANPCATIDA